MSGKARKSWRARFIRIRNKLAAPIGIGSVMRLQRGVNDGEKRYFSAGFTDFAATQQSGLTGRPRHP
jgi:hypothetical protein